jgi:hypothetical protein
MKNAAGCAVESPTRVSQRRTKRTIRIDAAHVVFRTLGGFAAAFPEKTALDQMSGRDAGGADAAGKANLVSRTPP